MKTTEHNRGGDIRTQLMNIAITDTLNANRTNDAIREALMATLIKKSVDMEALEIIAAIKEIGGISTIERTEKILSIIDRK